MRARTAKHRRIADEMRTEHAAPRDWGRAVRLRLDPYRAALKLFQAIAPRSSICTCWKRGGRHGKRCAYRILLERLT